MSNVPGLHMPYKTELTATEMQARAEGAVGLNR